MRIAYLSTDFGVHVPGTKGASVHVRQLVEALAQRGHEVLVRTPAAGELPAGARFRLAALPFDDLQTALQNELKQEAVCAGNRLPKDLRNLLYAAWVESRALPLLAEFRPDVVYERYALFGTAGLSIARRAGVPLLLEVNAPLVEEQREQRGLELSRVATTAQQLVFGGADELLVVSRWLARYVAAHGAAPDRVTVVPNAADPALFRPQPRPAAVRRRLGLGDDLIVLGFVGAMKPWHGVRRLVEALPGLGPRFRLLLVGDGPELEAVRARVRELGLADAVTIAGAVPHDEVPAWLGAADIALVPYDAAAAQYFSPVKLFECMAMALPIVAARVEQTEAILADGRTGWLYAAADADEPAATIRRVAADLGAARRVGVAAREQVLAHHTWERNAEHVELLAQRAQQRARPVAARQP
jgi:glycosyltransferase involved in cell wall biosynthesis